MTGAAEARRCEARHDAPVEEWMFACWRVEPGLAPLGVVSGYRVFAPSSATSVTSATSATSATRSWYWAALARAGEPLLHVADWHVPPRPDPLLVKGDGLWAEHVCDAPMEQWTVSNETYATALDHPDDALGRAFGTPTAVAFDLEWYATAAAIPLEDGYEQAGVVHGVIELAGGAGVHLDEAPAHRWHRWADALGPVVLPPAFAHTGVRAPFAFPDGTVADWALTPDGWRALDR